MAAEQNSSDATTELEEADTIELWISPEDRLLLDHAARESLDTSVPNATASSAATADAPGFNSASAAGDSTPSPPADTVVPTPALLAAAPAPVVRTLAAFPALSLRAIRSGRLGKWTRTRAAWQKLRQKPRGVSTAIDLAIVLALIGLAYLMQYQLATPAGPPPVARRLTAASALVPAVSADTAQVQFPPEESLPVYFRNPFDASEVFEFPPGTSQTDARDAVAELLMKRARERLSALDKLRSLRPSQGQGVPAITAQNSADPQ
ncbi:MAG TPA: hypothetical protein VGM84_24355 [Steroidobacteraceae bacterium]|jgi:hypothetical protein